MINKPIKRLGYAGTVRIKPKRQPDALKRRGSGYIPSSDKPPHKSALKRREAKTTPEMELQELKKKVEKQYSENKILDSIYTATMNFIAKRESELKTKE